MTAENPYESPESATKTTTSRSGIAAKLGTAMLVIGLAALAYGAFTFWIMPSLPPNTAWSGRLPSLYCVGAGIRGSHRIDTQKPATVVDKESNGIDKRGDFGHCRPCHCLFPCRFAFVIAPMQYRLRTLLVLLSTGLPGLAVYAQKAPITDAQKGRMTTYYEQLLLQGVHPLEAQIKDNLLHTRLIGDRPKQAFQRLDELKKELDTIHADADSVRQAIAVKARNLIHEKRTALEVNSTPLEDWAKRLDESPNDAATMSNTSQSERPFGVRGNARVNAYSAKALAQVQTQLAKWEQQVTDEDVKQRYSAAKAELARIERAIGPRAESRDSK